jgi:cation:H+ antiporter
MLILQLLAGLVLLVLGADALVRGASRIAAALGLSPLVIGLTVVAFGTSTPELAVSLDAASSKESEVVVGNVVGSNIFNILVIAGLAALVRPLSVARNIIRIDIPLMIMVSVALLLLGLDGTIGRLEGALLVLALVVYTGLQVRAGRRAVGKEANGKVTSARTIPWWLISAGLILGGLFFLVIGSDYLVDSSVTMAHHLGLSELIIGLTIVAAGTSLPELATSVMASIRRESDIAVGNVVGSNIFNILGVLGITATIVPGGASIPSPALWFDIPVMLAVALTFLPLALTGRSISRGEGLCLLIYYVVYVGFLIQAATWRRSGAEPTLALVFLLAPPLLLTVVVSLRGWWSMRADALREPRAPGSGPPPG